MPTTTSGSWGWYAVSDLRQFAAELIANPLVPVPPIEGVVARARHYRAARRRRQVGAGLCVVALALMAVARAGVGVGDRDSLRMVGNPRSDDAPVTSTSSVPVFGEDATTLSTLPWSGQNFDGHWSTIRHQRARNCPILPPRTADIEILAHDPSTTLRGEGPIDGVERLVDGFNKAGGICGRAIRLVRQSVDTADLGKAVAVLGMPGDEALDAAIADGRIARAGIPVIGDGLSNIQHRSAHSYPVGTSADVLTRMAVEHARARGARTFAIVYDGRAAFGWESATSFERYVRSVGGTVKASVALDPSAPVYAAQAHALTTACESGCDFQFLALLPETADQWLLGNPPTPRIELAGLPTLLSGGFAEDCFRTSNQHCNGLLAWSGFIPPFGPHSWNIEAEYAFGDPGSAMTEAAVVAGRVLLEVVEQLGPFPDHGSLRRALDAYTFTSYVAVPLRWPVGSNRIGNPVAQAWRLQVDGVVPSGTEPVAWDVRNLPLAKRQWHPAGTGWVRDPG